MQTPRHAEHLSLGANMTSTSSAGGAAAALPRTTLLDLHAVLLQCMAELMVGRDCAAFGWCVHSPAGV